MDAKTQNIYLIGPMGSGKSTLGRVVANQLGMDFFDADQELETLTGASVNLIFEVEGEAGFRTRESRLLKSLSEKHQVLVATGGGAILDPDNRAVLSQTGLTVWLKTSVEQQLARLARDKKRPLLQAENRRELLERLAAERNPLYSECADLVFTSRNQNVREVGTELARIIRNRLGSPDMMGCHENH